MTTIEDHFEYLHKNPPKPMNPFFHPKANEWSKRVVDSMEEDGYYDNHCRAECAAEYQRRYHKIAKEEMDGRTTESS